MSAVNKIMSNDSNIKLLFYSRFTQPHNLSDFFTPDLYWDECCFNRQNGTYFMEDAISPADCGRPIKVNLASFLCRYLAPEKRQVLCDWQIQCL